MPHGRFDAQCDVVLAKRVGGTDKTRRGVAVERIAETVKARIMEGRYAPGQRLVEADLTRDLGASRGPIREALRRLAAEGLLDLTPHRGASVRRLSRADVESLLEVLQVLARLGGRLAAQRIEENDNHRRAEEALEATGKFKQRSTAPLDVVAYMEENSRFHEAMSELSGNTVLKRLMLQLQIQLYRLHVRGLRADSIREDWTRGHEEMLLAVLAGDDDAAEAATVGYARRVRALILSLPDSAFG